MLQGSLKGIEFGGPEVAVAGKPTVEGAKAARVEPVDTALGHRLDTYEMGLAERFEMLRNGWRRDGEASSDLTGGARPRTQETKDSAPRGVSEGVECVHECLL